MIVICIFQQNVDQIHLTPMIIATSYNKYTKSRTKRSHKRKLNNEKKSQIT